MSKVLKIRLSGEILSKSGHISLKNAFKMKPVRNEAGAKDAEHESGHEHGLREGDVPVLVTNQIKLEKNNDSSSIIKLLK